MKITRVSSITGREHTLEVPVTEDQLTAWQNGELIQNAMPNVPAELREFIKTGITPHEWDAMFSDRTEEDGPELDEDWDLDEDSIEDWRDDTYDAHDPYDIEYDR